MTVQCCKCKRVHRDGCWLAEPPANDVPVTHSYCPVCEDECYIELFCAQASRSTRGNAQDVSQFVAGLIPEM